MSASWRCRSTAGGVWDTTGKPSAAFLSKDHGVAIAHAPVGFTTRFEHWLRRLGNPSSRKFPGRDGWTVEVMDRWRHFDGRDGDTVYLTRVRDPKKGIETILHFRDGVHESLVNALQEQLCAENEREDPLDAEQE